MTNRIYNFKEVLTEYTEIGKMDDRNQKRTAITNIMLHPEKDAETLKEIFTIYKAYTGLTNEKEISDKYFKQVTASNSFNGYYKLKVRRTFFYNKYKKIYTAANIKGDFDADTIAKSYMKEGGTGKLVQVRPNYAMFVTDFSNGKKQCFTDNLRNFEDGYVNRADVQVVVERGLSKNGIMLTLFKYRKLEAVDMSSSNHIEESNEELNDGLDDIFNNFDDFDLDVDFEDTTAVTSKGSEGDDDGMEEIF